MTDGEEEKSSGQIVGTSSPLPPGSQEIAPLGSVFQALQLGLTENDLEHPGTRKLLIELYRQSRVECGDLKEYRQKYHEADKRGAILEGKLTSYTAFDLIYGILLVLGGIIVGLSPAFWDKARFASFIFGGTGDLPQIIVPHVK
jgi:hypothetical protein